MNFRHTLNLTVCGVVALIAVGCSDKENDEVFISIPPAKTDVESLPECRFQNNDTAVWCRGGAFFTALESGSAIAPSDVESITITGMYTYITETFGTDQDHWERAEPAEGEEMGNFGWIKFSPALIDGAHGLQVDCSVNEGADGGPAEEGRGAKVVTEIKAADGRIGKAEYILCQDAGNISGNGMDYFNTLEVVNPEVLTVGADGGSFTVQLRRTNKWPSAGSYRWCPEFTDWHFMAVSLNSSSSSPSAVGFVEQPLISSSGAIFAEHNYGWLKLHPRHQDNEIVVDCEVAPLDRASGRCAIIQCGTEYQGEQIALGLRSFISLHSGFTITQER